MNEQSKQKNGNESPVNPSLLRINKKNEIMALLSFAVALLSAFMLWGAASWTGVVGRFIGEAVHGLLGLPAKFLPILFFYFSLELYLQKENNKAASRRFLVLLFFITASLMISSLTLDIPRLYQAAKVSEGSSAIQAIGLLWDSGNNPELLTDSSVWSGGVVGGLLCLGLNKVIGRVGCLIVTISSLLALSVLLFDLSWKQAIGKSAMAVVETGKKVSQAGKNILEKQKDMKKDQMNNEEINSPKDHKGGMTFMKIDKNKANVPVEKLSDEEHERHSQHAYEAELPLSFPEGDWTISYEEKSEYWDLLKAPRMRVEPQNKRQFLDNTSGIRPAYIPVKDAYLLQFKSNHDSQEEIPQTVSQTRTLNQRKDLKNCASEENTLESIAEKIEENKEKISHGTDRAEWKDRGEQIKENKGTVKVPTVQEGLPYAPPPLHLLNEEKKQVRTEEDKEEIRLLGAKLEKTLQDFGVDAEVINFVTGPTISRFEIKPGPGVKVSKIVNLSDDIALALAATGLRIEAPIPGKSAIGIEIPNRNTKPVLLRGIIESDAFTKHKSPLAAVLGRDIQGGEMICDISSMPHLLIAGATGSGKSVCINSILISLLYRSSPEDLRLLMIDPKVVELSVYNKIPHLLQPVVTDPKEAFAVLDWAVDEMNRRYELFAENSVRDFKGYNKLVADGLEEGEKLPLILIVIDELSDLMATTPAEVENAISRLTAMARAAGIHLIIATQRPSVDVITGVIKANIPSRIAFSVASQVDSRTILDTGGAEQLLGKGDMLYFPQSASKPLRGQGAFVTDAEVERVINYLRTNYNHDYSEEVARAVKKATQAQLSGTSSDGQDDTDELIMDALQTCVETGYASVSMLQRRLNVGYPRAARMIDSLHEHNWIGPFEGSKPRKVLITEEEYEEIRAEYEENILNS